MTEQDLVKRCIKKDSASQKVLFEQYASVMMTVCRRYSGNQQEAEDILQESFIRVFLYINQYKFKGSLEGWIKRIVVNCALRALQKKKIHFVEIKDEQLAAQPVDSDALSNLNEEELLKLISSLPEGYRIVFNLYVLEGYNHDEIAGILHIKTATSRSQLAKARNLLKEKIKSLNKMPI